VKRRRLDRVAETVAAMPVRDDLLRESFDRFRTTGELPDHGQLAAALLRRALYANPASHIEDPAAYFAQLHHAFVQAGMRPPAPSGEAPRVPLFLSLRERLFHEALSPRECVRLPAHALLRLLVVAGGDVTDPQFLDETMAPPDYGTLGLHLLGWPGRLASPPFTRRAKRLLARFAELRRRIGQAEGARFEELASAVQRFAGAGVVPKDELLRECVAAGGELVELTARFCEARTAGTTRKSKGIAGAADALRGLLSSLLDLARGGDLGLVTLLLGQPVDDEETGLHAGQLTDQERSRRIAAILARAEARRARAAAAGGA
jgi:hypothetical protein